MSAEISNFLAIASTIITVFSAIIGVYFSEIRHLSQPFSKNYTKIYGDYKIFNFSRERTKNGISEIMVEWDVSISREILSKPFFRMTYDEGNIEWRRCYEGRVIIKGDMMLIFAKEKWRENGDTIFMAFHSHGGSKIDIRSGFLCGFRDPVAPYAGVHLLCDVKYNKDDAAYILGDRYDLHYEEYESRSNTVKKARLKLMRGS